MTASISSARGARLEALASAVILSWGWPRRLIAFSAGALGALALAPFGYAVAMIAPMTVAVWLIDGAAETSTSGSTRWATLRSAFAIGWWWGFGYFLAGLWWLGAAFLVDGDQFLWALPFGVVGLPLVLGVFPGLGFALARAIWPEGALRPLALAVGLTVSEFVRANILTGFPWNEFGMALGADLWPAQAAASASGTGWPAAVPLAALAALVVLFGVLPETLLRLTQSAAAGLADPQAYLQSVFPGGMPR